MHSDATMLAADTNARCEALDTSRSFIVQAPAGSGKTELLIQRYLKLLGEVTSPEEVLAITFTRKAALEMQLRVISALREARAGDTPQEPHRQLTLDLATTVLLRDKEHDWQLIDTPRRMRIQTLDALNASIARSLPLSSGLGGSAQTVTDEEMRTLYRAAAIATLDWLTTDDPMNSVVEQVLSHLDNNTGLYVAYISRMLETRDQWLLFVGSGPGSEFADAGKEAVARTNRERAIELLITRHLENVQRAFPQHMGNELIALARYAADFFHNEGAESHFLYSVEGRDSLPGAAADDLAAWQALANLLLKQKDGWRKTVNKLNGFPAGDQGQKKAMCDLLLELADEDALAAALEWVRRLPEPKYSDEQWDVLLALVKLLPYAVAELQNQFTRQGVTDHVEVARAAGAALGSVEEPGEVALLLDYSIRHLLIDEMQDTSIGQYHLLEMLTGGWEQGDGRTLFCVGDPMQSIYRFRDADVSRFLQTRRDGIGALRPESLLLRRNFRSGEHLVHWFNTVFCQLMPVEDDAMTGAIAYAESAAVPAHADMGECRVHPLFDASPVVEAKVCAGVIEQCLAEHPERDTAVLVRSRTQLPYLLAQLRRAGIEYQAIEIDRLTDLPEIIDVAALTRALCHDGDRLAWLAILRGPWVGLAWQDLHSLVMNDSYSTVRELLSEPARMELLSADGRQRVAHLQHILEPFSRPGAAESLRERVEQLWFALGGPALLQDQDQLENVYRFFAVLEKVETAGTLADVAELETLLDQERVSSHADANCRLQIMTMHKAKGLQFDNVVLYGLGRSTSANWKSVLSWLNLAGDDGHSEMIISPVGPRFELENDGLHQFIEATETEKDRVELDRLLYVACTRAIHSLHLIGHTAVTADGEDFRPPHAGSLLRRLWPGLRNEFSQAFAAYEQSATPADDEQSFLQVPVLKRLSYADLSMQPPPLPIPAGPATNAENDDRPVEYYWVGSAARHAGTIAHHFLRQLSVADTELPAATPQEYRVECIRRARQFGVSGTDADKVWQRVRESLDGILQDEKGRWLLRGEGHAELALTGLWKSRTESIVIDRVRVDHDGIHWIVDYKTSTHEGGDLATFLQHEVARYQPQLEKYVAIYQRLVDAPVRAALYFPLLHQFREIRIPT